MGLEVQVLVGVCGFSIDGYFGGVVFGYINAKVEEW